MPAYLIGQVTIPAPVRVHRPARQSHILPGSVPAYASRSARRITWRHGYNLQNDFGQRWAPPDNEG
jgi:hypothetical protein